jgi:catechol 2,3-dioxygenase-like lactoylglutathione lyase family enzyme
MAVLHFSHTGICVSDIERSTAFYRDVLGFTQHHGMHLEGEPTATLVRIPDVALDVVYLERDGTVIELLGFPELVESRDALPRELNRKGLTHLSFNVSDMQDLLSRIEDGGGSVMSETQLGSFGDPVVAIFVTDPDGTLIELVQSPADPTRLPMVPEGMKG